MQLDQYLIYNGFTKTHEIIKEGRSIFIYSYEIQRFLTETEKNELLKLLGVDIET